MSDEKPDFDPTQPFQTQAMPDKPAFDPSQPFEKGPGELESFGRAAVNNLPFGGQLGALGTEALSDKPENYSQALQEWNQKAAQAKQANPVSYGAGAVTGAVAPAFLPVVGESLKAAPILGNAAMGAGYALGNEDLSKNAAENVKKGLGGAVVGGGLGAVGEGISNLVGKGSPAAERLASRTTAQALDISPLAVRREAMAAGMSPERFVTDLGQRADAAIPNLVEIGDSANSKLNKVFEAHDTAGTSIGQIVNKMTKSTEGTFPEAQETINALRAAAKNYYQVDGGDLALQKTADRLEALQDAGKLDFDRLQQVKSAIGHGFKKADPPAGTEDIYGILKGGLQKAIDRTSAQNTGIAPQLKKLNQIYSVTSDLIPAMSRTAAREVAGANVGGGVMSKLVPTAIGGAIGGPVGAALGGGAKYLQETIAPDLGKNLAYKTMNAFQRSKLPARAGQSMQNLLNDYLASKYGQNQ